MIDEDFRALLLSLLPTGTVVEKGKISSEQIATRVFFERANSSQDCFLNGDEDPGNETTFNVEVASNDEDETQTLTEQLKTGNGTLTTLSGAITSSATSITVASAMDLPTSGLPFSFAIGTEVLSVTDVVSTTYTITRGANGTTVAIHANNSELMTEQGAVASLVGAITDVATSVAVEGYLTLGPIPCVALIDDEEVVITAIGSTTLTVIRGYRDSVAASHLDAARITAPGLNGYMGAVGGAQILGIFVSDHSDSYEPKLLDVDEGYFVATFQADVFSV